MKAYVVDTNVPIAANGGSKTHVNERCQLACVRKLRQLIDSEIVAIDEFGYIFQEYRKHLTLGGSQNVGDEFFKYLFENQYNHDRIQQIRISSSNDDDIGFEELPANKLDPSDRKFLAVSVKAGATILNATDSDWDEQGLLLQKLGVETCQLCPENSRK